ncbi:MAG: O-acetylhomoserine aminocarboxypropyltransferase/cysteine synthase [Planctomycetota bacterium]
MTTIESTPLDLGTIALHAGQEPDPTTKARAVPIYATSSYVFDDTAHAADLFALKTFGNIYSRLMNPTTDVLEKRLTELDGGVGALAVSSGQQAILYSILNIAKAGDNIVSGTSLYGGTWTLFTQTLKRLGIEVRFFDQDDPSSIDSVVDERTRAVYIETIGNPRNDIPDYEGIARHAHAAGVPVIADNTALTPVLFRPFDHGIDIAVYSLTKFLGGHGTHIGGAIVDSGKFDWTQDAARWPEFTAPDPSYHGVVLAEALAPIGNISYIIRSRTHLLRDLGGTLSPFASFLFLQGIETVHLRVPQHAANALAVAQYLDQHEAVEWVNYPGLASSPSHERAQRVLTNGFGAIVGFGIRGGAEAGRKFIENCKLFSHLANIGDAKSLAIHPATTTHSQLTEEEQARTGVTPEYVRLSVGLESRADIVADLEQALAASQA